MKKILYIILDGLGDLPIEELGGNTPLEAASTPYMDSLVKEGMQGLMYPVKKGIAPESDIAVISLLGYDAHKVYTGRGPLEAFALGIEVNDGDLALRVNFATVKEESNEILDRRAGRDLTTEEASGLSKEINEKVKLERGSFVFRNTVGHRGILVIRKEGKLRGFITNTDPAYGREGVFGVAKEIFPSHFLEAKPMPGYEDDPGAILSAELVNEFVEKSRKVLQEAEINKRRKEKGKLVANIILCRDAGDSLPKFIPIGETTGLKFASFVQMPVEKGIALLCKMEVVEVPLPSGNLKRDYQCWAELVKKNISGVDGLYVHIKGPDEPGHDGDFFKKKEVIELIDKYFFGSLLENINKKDYLICVTADHSTPCKLKAHSEDPVPVLIYGWKQDNTRVFSEREAQKGRLGEILGKELIFKLKEFAQG